MIRRKDYDRIYWTQRKITCILNGWCSEHKKAKGTEKCVIKWILTVKNHKDSLLNNKIILQSQQRFKSDHENVYTEQINKIALSSSDNKRLQTFDKITTYPYGTNGFKVCESEFQRSSKI